MAIIATPPIDIYFVPINPSEELIELFNTTDLLGRLEKEFGFDELNVAHSWSFIAWPPLSDHFVDSAPAIITDPSFTVSFQVFRESRSFDFELRELSFSWYKHYAWEYFKVRQKIFNA